MHNRLNGLNRRTELSKGIEWVLYEKCSSFVKKMLGNGFKTDSGGQQVKLQLDRARNLKIIDASFR